MTSERPEVGGLREEMGRLMSNIGPFKKAHAAIDGNSGEVGVVLSALRREISDQIHALLAAHPDPTPEPDAGDGGGRDGWCICPGFNPVMPDDAHSWHCSKQWRRLAEQERVAREQGRAEGDAEWAAAVEGLAAEAVSCRLHCDANGMRSPYCSACEDSGYDHECPDRVPCQHSADYLRHEQLRALLTADHTKALDAVKAQAAREALLEAADALTEDWVKNGRHQGVPGAYSPGYERWLRACADRNPNGGAS